MAVVKVPTNFNIDVEFEIPEFYRRFLSLLIDFLILFFYYKIIAAILSSVFNNADLLDIDKQYDMQWVVIVLVMGPILCYHLLMEVATSGQSVGKKITSLRVVDENGGKASLSQYMIRWLLREIWFIIILLISFSHEYAG
ncbi:MAG TPA: RDD family protein, partial [Chitinophagaceae bacterium]|nr:RDD family protein [Chitinophagaceae bacterium]